MSQALIFMFSVMLVSAALSEETPKDQNRGMNPSHNGNPNNMNSAIDYNNMYPNMDISGANSNPKPHGEMPKHQLHGHNGTKMSQTAKGADMQKIPEGKAPENPTNGKN